jgi:hypothetical protein
MDAHSDYPTLGRNNVFPTNAMDAKNFAKAYLADLKVSLKGDMKGKILLKTQANFPTFKKNKKFRKWLDGSTTAPLRQKVLLIKTELTGSVWVSAGFFFNVAPRHDMAMNFHQQIVNNLSSRTQATGPIPEFQIKVYPLHGNGGTKVRLYQMLTSSVTDVQLLTEKMAIVLPKPTPDISYIPQKVRDSLLPSKKAEYTAMQRVFEQNHNSRLFGGLKNMKLKLARPGAGGSKTGIGASGITIYEWLTRVKAADSCNMFSKVFECENGDVKLWHHMLHNQEARAWLLTALAEIAKFSGIYYEKDRSSADVMFKESGKSVGKRLQVQHGGDTASTTIGFYGF